MKKRIIESFFLSLVKSQLFHLQRTFASDFSRCFLSDQPFAVKS